VRARTHTHTHTHTLTHTPAHIAATHCGATRTSRLQGEPPEGQERPLWPCDRARHMPQIHSVRQIQPVHDLTIVCVLKLSGHVLVEFAILARLARGCAAVMHCCPARCCRASAANLRGEGVEEAGGVALLQHLEAGLHHHMLVLGGHGLRAAAHGKCSCVGGQSAGIPAKQLRAFKQARRCAPSAAGGTSSRSDDSPEMGHMPLSCTLRAQLALLQAFCSTETVGLRNGRQRRCREHRAHWCCAWAASAHWTAGENPTARVPPVLDCMASQCFLLAAP